MVEKPRPVVCVCASCCKCMFIPLQGADYSCLSLTGPSGWVLQLCGMGGVRSLSEVLTGVVFSFALHLKKRELCKGARRKWKSLAHVGY